MSSWLHQCNYNVTRWNGRYFQDGNHDKRKVSWYVIELQEKVKVQEIGARSNACVLERKSSIGPCFRSAAPFGRPSGIAICLPNKHEKPAAVEEYYSGHQSTINITLSKKCLVNRKSTRNEKNDKGLVYQIPRNNFFGTLKEKLANMTGKIKDVLSA